MRRLRFRRPMCLIALALVSTTVTAAPVSEWGSGTVISVRDCSNSADAVACGSDVTAPNIVPLLEVGGLFQAIDEQNDFGPSIGASQVVFSDAVPNPGVQLDVPAILGSAFSSPIGADNTRVGVSTGAYQGYTYMGDVAATITIGATLDYDGLSANAWPAPDSSTISVALGAFDTDIVLDGGLAGCPLFFCVGGTLFDFADFGDSGPFDGSPLSETISFDVVLDPGQSFFVGIQMQVLAERGAFLDSFGTLQAFIEGDDEVLMGRGAATSVPVPGTLPLLCIGLIAVLRRARIR